jgi:hypothetical protein
VQNEPNLARPSAGDGGNCAKRTQFGRLRLLRRWTPRNDIRRRGLGDSGLPGASGRMRKAIVQNEPNFQGAERTLSTCGLKSYSRKGDMPGSGKQSQFAGGTGRSGLEMPFSPGTMG